MKKAIAWGIVCSVFVIFFVVIAVGFIVRFMMGTFMFGYNAANDAMIKVIGRL